MRKIFNTAVLASLLMPCMLHSQTLEYDVFMQRVAQKNAGYLVEKYNVDIADANLQASRVFNDPELSVEYGNNEDWSLQMGQSVDVGLEYSFSLGNMRAARMDVARSEKALSQAALADYLCSLKAEAAASYAGAWAACRKEKLMRESYENMAALAAGDSLRLLAGDINKMDALRSGLEARSALNDWIASRAERDNALGELSLYMGGEAVSQMPESLPLLMPASTSLQELLRCAEENRADLRAAELTRELSAGNLRLVQASRALEIGLSAGYSYNTEVRNEIAPAPKFNGFSVGVSIPLKFSSMNRGEAAAAKSAVMQSDMACKAARQQIELDVNSAYNSWCAASQTMQNYDSSMVADAQTVIDSCVFGYSNGETGLLDLLSARQAYIEVMSGYIDACAASFAATAALNRAAGE